MHTFPLAVPPATPIKNGALPSAPFILQMLLRFELEPLISALISFFIIAKSIDVRNLVCNVCLTNVKLKDAYITKLIWF